MRSYVLYVDGASRGNPGEASIGVSLQDRKGKEVAKVSAAIGEATNNEAEYRALIAGLKLAGKRKGAEVEVRTDSELVVRQMNGQYKVRHRKLKGFWAEAQELSRKFARFSLRHVRREENARADELANEALDRELS